MEYIVGIDEAGRGPVLGPMVYACAGWPTSLDSEYSKLGFADSKTINEEKRENFFETIKKLDEVVYEVEVITSKVISNSMLSRTKTSLNTLSTNAAKNLIKKLLDKGVNVKYVFVDTVGRPEAYEKQLSEEFPGLEFTVRPKADSLFAVVSAASICAKVTRDSYIKEMSQTLGKIGCGYPSDPNTRKWLSESIDPVFGLPEDYVRVSWQTCTNLYLEKCIKVAWEKPKEFFKVAKNYYLEEFLCLTSKNPF